jgi:hypothetical protein
LKAQWAAEHESWNRRDLSLSRYVYWWADGIHNGLRSEHSDGAYTYKRLKYEIIFI